MASAGAAALARGAVARGHGGRVVRVTGGAVRGIASDTPGVTAWLGIPFAAPPVGPLRWRPPQPVQPWPGIRAADRFSASPVASPQDPHSVYFTRAVTMDEDCLTLNVWAPARPSARPRPVMVWIYGGAFVYGASDDALYDGARMAADDVVFVSINYRVGILGFFAHPELDSESADGVSGNYGLMDQIAALRWVRENIAAFGGDPHNVTIMGQSAGAFSVGFHLVMPPSRGLFHKGIAQSGAPMGRPSSFILLGEHAAMRDAGVDFAREVGAGDLAALRAMDAARLVAANSHAWRFYPAIDGVLVPRHPRQMIATGDHADVPLIVGFNRDEGTVFPALGDGTPVGLATAIDQVYGAEARAARQIFATATDAEAVTQGKRAFGDIVFDWNSTALAILMARAGGAHCWFYHFTYDRALPADAHFTEGTAHDLGAFHGSEIGFALRTQSVRTPAMTVEQKAVTDLLSGYWLTFARSADPNRIETPAWPAFAPGRESVLHIGGPRPHIGPVPLLARDALLGRAMGDHIIDDL